MSLYFLIVKNMWRINIKFFITPLPMISFIFGSLLFIEIFWELLHFNVSSFFELVFAVVIVLCQFLTAAFYPFMKIWTKTTDSFIRKFPSRSIAEHFTQYKQELRNIDANTADDTTVEVRYYNRGYADYKVTYTRDTANSKKFFHYEQYIADKFILPRVIYVFIWVLTPILIWFVMPKLIEKTDLLRVLNLTGKGGI